MPAGTARAAPFVPLYPTVQARAAHLLYFVINDHPFADGNKRIGTLLFLEYLRRNRLLEQPDGRPRLANQEFPKSTSMRMGAAMNTDGSPGVARLVPYAIESNI